MSSREDLHSLPLCFSAYLFLPFHQIERFFSLKPNSDNFLNVWVYVSKVYLDIPGVSHNGFPSETYIFLVLYKQMSTEQHREHPP